MPKARFRSAEGRREAAGATTKTAPPSARPNPPADSQQSLPPPSRKPYPSVDSLTTSQLILHQLFRVLMSLARKLQRALRRLMRPHMVILVMRRSRRLMRMCSLQMAFSRRRVMCSRHVRNPHPIRCHPHPQRSLESAISQSPKQRKAPSPATLTANQTPFPLNTH